MKKLLVLFLFITTITNAQFSIKGEMQPPNSTDWIILYKIEGARQIYIKDSKIKPDTVTLDNKKYAIGKFEFTLPATAKKGMYRVSYKRGSEGFVDFLFNKENVEFTFNPEFPDQSIVYTASKENQLYRDFLEAIAIRQQQLDSIQMIGLKSPKKTSNNAYQTKLKQVNDIHTIYLDKSKKMLANHFIKAIQRKNPDTLITDRQQYFNYVVKNFFANMNFNSKELYNSSFLVDRISDYVFYLNYSDDAKLQEQLYKESIPFVIEKIKDEQFKKDVLEFLISQFNAKKDVVMVDYLFDTFYNKLQPALQSEKFKNKILTNLKVEVGRIAPDFSWKFEGKNYQLSKLNDAKKYLLVFWSTKCSHCLRDIPKLHEYMKSVKDAKVIGFAIEDNAYAWNNFIYKLNGWYNVLGLNRWENETARTYNVFSTPNYFVLDADKKIIAKPHDLKDVEKLFPKQ